MPSNVCVPQDSVEALLVLQPFYGTDVDKGLVQCHMCELCACERERRSASDAWCSVLMSVLLYCRTCIIHLFIGYSYWRRARPLGGL